MSKFTTEVRFICEQNIGLPESADRPAVHDIVRQAYPHIFDSDLELYDPLTGKVSADSSYKDVLFPKILFHYYTREIGLETVALWKLKLNTKMREILPYYNQLYASEQIKFDPLENVRVTDKHEQQVIDDATTKNEHIDKTDDITDTTNQTVDPTTYNHGKQKQTDTFGEQNRTDNLGQQKTTDQYGNTSGSTTYGEVSSKQRDNHSTLEAFSDTPQGSLSGVTDNNYLSSARKTTVTGVGDGDVSTTSTHTDSTTAESHTDVHSTDAVTDKHKTDSYADTHERDGYVDTVTRKDNNKSILDGTKKGSYKTDYDNKTDTDYTHIKIGKEGSQSYSKMLNEFRDTFLNIDMRIIDELKDLFMLIWD
jgi:hypothetical protein